MEVSSKIFTDQTWQFPVTYTRGYKYMMVAYEQDSNAIMVEPKKSKEGTDIKRVYKVIQKTLKDIGLNPKHTFRKMSAILHLKHLWKKKRNCFRWSHHKFAKETHNRGTYKRGRTISSVDYQAVPTDSHLNYGVISSLKYV